MADFKQAFSQQNTLSFGTSLNSWAGGANTSDEYNNGTTLYDEIMLEIAIAYGTGTLTTTYYDVRVLACTDGAGTIFSSPQSPYLILPAFDVAGLASGSRIYTARFVAPQRFKIYIALAGSAHTTASSGNSVKWQGVYYTGA
jgi:hypothetical protein